jgi:hypothetical protein
MPAIFTPAATVSHPSVVPYISLADYASAPTAVDTTALIPGGSVQGNLVELGNVIRRASAWADNLCFQILAATLDTQMESGVRVRNDGTVHVACDFWPVLELDSFLAGPSPSTMSAVTQTADIWLKGRKVLVVPVYGQSANPSNSLAFPGPLLPGHRAYCQWAYWNGWPHSMLAATTVKTATSLVLQTALPQAAAGQTLMIWDGASTEPVQVAASFTGGKTVPLAAATVFDHTLPTLPTTPGSITVTALPDDVRQAVISLTSALIKTRGAESYEMASIGQEPSKSDLIEGGGLEDLAVAVDLLGKYQRSA